MGDVSFPVHSSTSEFTNTTSCHSLDPPPPPTVVVPAVHLCIHSGFWSEQSILYPSRTKNKRFLEMGSVSEMGSMTAQKSWEEWKKSLHNGFVAAGLYTLGRSHQFLKGISRVEFNSFIPLKMPSVRSSGSVVGYVPATWTRVEEG